MVTNVRQPAVAGQFYPSDPQRLRATVKYFLRQAQSKCDGCADAPPRAIIVPHAGYPYSGPVAASAYAQVAAAREIIRRVILLGPAHRVPVRGLAASSAVAFATPLGDVPLDRDAVERLLQLPQVHLFDEAHAPEHGLEVHLPFLQLTLDDCHLVPLVVGEATPDEVAAVMEPFSGDEDALLVISSDLSHYLDYESARLLDRQTSDAIEALRPLGAGRACGRYAINGLLQMARKRGWRARTLDLRNSGDTAGPRDQVVGYGAYRFETPLRERSGPAT